MGSLQPWHWAILVVVLIVLFGAKKLPDAARSLGKSMRIFKSELRELQNDAKSETAVTQTPPATAVQSERVDPPTAPGPGRSDARPA